VTGGIGGMVLQCWGRRETVRRMPIESHDAWRTDSPRRRKIDVGGGSDVRWRGGEVTGGRRRQAWWGVGRQRRVERMEKKNGEERERGRWHAAFEGARGCRAVREKGGGSARCRVGAKEGGRGGPAQWSAVQSGPRPSSVGGSAVVRQRRAVGRGQRGAARLTGGTGRQWDRVGSDGVRERERERARQRGEGR
jgi:hypothetical protein